MKKKPLVTSVSLPKKEAMLWRQSRREIMQFSERYLRIQMRRPMRRGVTKQYNNCPEQTYDIVTTRFSGVEYDTLHFVAATLRVSVSLLIYGLIKLWSKPTRRAIRRFFSINYSGFTTEWHSDAGFVEESITFWMVDNPNGPPPIEHLLPA